MQSKDSSNQVNDWNGKEIEVCYSANTQIFATLHPNQNIVSMRDNAFQSPELKRKYAISCEDSNFGKSSILSNRNWSLGYYCELQSILSPQAIAWSVFGSISHATSIVQRNWMMDFFSSINLEEPDVNDAQFFFWRKLLDAKKATKPSPEIDIMITTPNSLNMVLCYWNINASNTQTNLIKERILELDECLYEMNPSHLANERTLNLIVIDQNTHLQEADLQNQLNHKFSTTTWQTICNFKSHPSYREIQRYYDWKSKHSNPQLVAGDKVA